MTLPRAAKNADVAEIYFHAFGQVANRDLRQLESSLAEHGPQLRDRLLVATRELELDEFEDPALTSLRDQIASVVNELVPGEPLQSVGFYRFNYSDF